MPLIEDDARSVFLAALEHAAGQWPAFLDEACGGNAELRARVEQLLGAHQALGSIHGGNPGVTPPADGLVATIDDPAVTVTEVPGTMVGPYKLLEQIGEGGFGVVFMAEQTEPVRRKVALKILKPGMDTRQVVARFEAERQALAIMDHPNIARVYDGGMTGRNARGSRAEDGAPSAKTSAREPRAPREGRPYFVMELVKGVPITEFCDQHHLTPRQRLELFIPVCQAVQHAHQKGIIHRDLKPSNVLVSVHDTTPVPKVIDFGVAKALGQELTDKTLFTGFAQMIGTPLYMSPEQAGQSGLDVDTRSDVYSLGVLLYELLTGTTPFARERFKRAAYDEICRIIREEEPPKPSTRLSELSSRHTPCAEPGTRSVPTTLASISALRQTEPAKLTRLVRGELDWIVMKALEKDRNRRYETANGFAMDVQRYLADEPVLACPPSIGYRLRKFVRRNRMALAAAAIAAVGLVGLVVGLVVNNRMIRQEQARTEAARQGEARRRAQAMSALEAMTNELTESLLGRQLVLTAQHKRFLHKALQAFTEFGADQGEDREVRRSVAAAHPRVGRIRHALGELREAEEAIVVARGLYAKLIADFPDDPVYQDEMGRVLIALANVHVVRGQRAEAQAGYREAIALLERLPEATTGWDHRAVLASALYNLATSLRDDGRLEEAISLFQRAHQCLTDLMAKKPDEVTYAHMAGTVREGVGQLFKEQGRLEEAEAATREGVTLLERTVARFPTNPDPRYTLALALLNQDSLLRKRGKIDLAEASCRKGVAVIEKLATEYPSVAKYVAHLAGAHNALGLNLSLRGKIKEAEAAFMMAAAVRERLPADQAAIPENRSIQATVLFNRGSALATMGRFDEALGVLRESVVMAEKLAAEFPNDRIYRHKLSESLGSLAVYHLRLGQVVEAEAAQRKALAIAEQLIVDFPGVPEYRAAAAGDLSNLAAILHDSRRVEEAAILLRRAASLFADLAAQFPKVIGYRSGWGTILQNLGLMEHTLGRLKEAEAALRDAIQLRAALVAEGHPEFHPEVAGAYVNLANLLDDLKRHDEAEAAFRTCIAIQEKLAAQFPEVSVHRQHLGYSIKNLALMLGKLRRWEEAEAAYRRALDIRAQLVAQFPTALPLVAELGECKAELGHLARARGDPNTALDWYAQAEELLTQALAKNPTLYKARRCLPEVYETRAEILASRSEHAAAARDWERAAAMVSGAKRLEFRVRQALALAQAGELERALALAAESATNGSAPPGILCDLARVYALAAKASADTAAQDRHAGRALELLRSAKLQGAGAAAELKTNPVWDRVRAHPDFPKLVAELEAKK